MSPIEHIRKHVLEMTQAAFAAVAEVSQGTVSKWEAGELEPDRGELAKIRAYVADQGKPWDDSWFFETPATSAEA